MYYLIYKITNLVNGKFYIGAHRTEKKEDNYMGSGKHIKRAINKHGLENFKKEIIIECSSIEEMFSKEREMVVVDGSISYNISGGGDGGNYDGSIRHKEFSRRGGLTASKIHTHRLKTDEKYREKHCLAASLMGKNYKERTGVYPFEGKKHTEEAKRRIAVVTSKCQSGSGNSQYGTLWIMNEITGESIRIKKAENIPEGWVKGRKIK